MLLAREVTRERGPAACCPWRRCGAAVRGYSTEGGFVLAGGCAHLVWTERTGGRIEFVYAREIEPDVVPGD